MICHFHPSFILHPLQFGQLSCSCSFLSWISFRLPVSPFLSTLKLVRLLMWLKKYLFAFRLVSSGSIGMMPGELRIAFFLTHTNGPCGSRTRQLPIRPMKFRTWRCLGKKRVLSNLLLWEKCFIQELLHCQKLCHL